MGGEIIGVTKQLINLGLTLLIALLVWNYYRSKTCTLSQRYSTFGPRFWTGSVDACVLWPVTFITSGLLSLNVPNMVAAMLIIVESIAWLLYTVVMHARYGQTVGKMVTKVKVVDFRTEGNISWLQAWLREGIPAVLSLGLLGYEVFVVLTGSVSPSAIASGEAFASGPFWITLMLPFLWFVAEVLTMLTNEKRRALHDFIAGTVVIRTNALGVQASAPPNAGSTDAPSASVS